MTMKFKNNIFITIIKNSFIYGCFIRNNNIINYDYTRSIFFIPLVLLIVSSKVVKKIPLFLFETWSLFF